MFPHLWVHSTATTTTYTLTTYLIPSPLLSQFSPLSFCRHTITTLCLHWGFSRKSGPERATLIHLLQVQLVQLLLPLPGPSPSLKLFTCLEQAGNQPQHQVPNQPTARASNNSSSQTRFRKALCLNRINPLRRMSRRQQLRTDSNKKI